MHVGACESSIVGKTSAQFDLFGSSVNFCARLEQACPPGCVHVSTDVMSWVDAETEGWRAESLEIRLGTYGLRVLTFTFTFTRK